MLLKYYQQRSLDELSAYFRLAEKHGPKTAFIQMRERTYREVSVLERTPYVCLRVPTGGGKTLMASHALAIAARDYLHADRVVCLWLVPSNTILQQTLAALKNRTHTYRQALDTAFNGNVVVMDLADALYVSQGDLNGATAILVSTLAALRVEETDGRKIYEPNGNLQPHFVGLDDRLRDKLEKEGDGRVIYSLANVLRMRCPIVIMDEAHNARTPLSFDTLARFAPSCVIEFTATPETKHNENMGVFASNVLHHVSAAELKQAEMIKLPIKLRTRTDWKQALSDALAKREELEKVALENEKATGEYLRPLLLIAAQPHNKNKPTLTVEVVKETLVKDFQIPEEGIATATGQTRELDDVNLFGRIALRIIITVQALREGWDCSFAYVLCSLAEQHSARSVEQILGRILRMPGAKKKNRPELNVAYAYAASSSFITTARALEDALIENGFEKMEAKDFIERQSDEPGLFDDGSSFGRTVETVSAPPDMSRLDPRLRDRVKFDGTTMTLAFTGIMSGAVQAALEQCFSANADRQAVARLRTTSRGEFTTSQGDAGKEVFRVPWLSVRIGDQLELFGEEHFLQTTWNIADCDAMLTEGELPSTWIGGRVGEIDITEKGKVELTHHANELHQQMTLLAGESGWDAPTLVRWLDRNIRHPDIPQIESSLFIHRLVTQLLESRGVTVAQLARMKYPLRNAVEEKINTHRNAYRQLAYQEFLFGPNAAQMAVDRAHCFAFEEDGYCPIWYYEGGYKFKCHGFRHIGELKSEGEEYECAVFIDQMDEVERWFRNLPCRPESSFWLPTSTDRFNPDFVVFLNDGRVLVVEYKGGDRADNADSREKKALGELWEAKSNGCCVFVMPVKKDWQAIASAIKGDSRR